MLTNESIDLFCAFISESMHSVDMGLFTVLNIQSVYSLLYSLTFCENVEKDITKIVTPTKLINLIITQPHNYIEPNPIICFSHLRLYPSTQTKEWGS